MYEMRQHLRGCIAQEGTRLESRGKYFVGKTSGGGCESISKHSSVLPHHSAAPYGIYFVGKTSGGGCESIEYSTICEFSATLGEFHKYLLRFNRVFFSSPLLMRGGDTSAVGDHHLVGKTSEGGCESTESAFCPKSSSAAPYGIHFVGKTSRGGCEPIEYSIILTGLCPQF